LPPFSMQPLLTTSGTPSKNLILRRRTAASLASRSCERIIATKLLHWQCYFGHDVEGDCTNYPCSGKSRCVRTSLSGGDTRQGRRRRSAGKQRLSTHIESCSKMLYLTDVMPSNSRRPKTWYSAHRGTVRLKCSTSNVLIIKNLRRDHSLFSLAHAGPALCGVKLWARLARQQPLLLQKTAHVHRGCSAQLIGRGHTALTEAATPSLIARGLSLRKHENDLNSPTSSSWLALPAAPVGATEKNWPATAGHDSRRPY